MRTAIYTGVSAFALAAAAPLLAQATVPADCVGVAGSCSVIDSVGSDNTATVDQDGSGNASEILQDAVGADASVTQDGDGNLSNIDQFDAEATLADPAAIVAAIPTQASTPASDSTTAAPPADTPPPTPPGRRPRGACAP